MEMATEENVDLIVIWTTGLKGVSKIKALGSVARNVSERAKCPVMLVR
jgi:nucleotide-binding universal stress UspA family protein